MIREKKEREAKEEEIVESLREISNRINEALRKTRTEREKTEETLVLLVEKVVEKIKREMLEMNLWISFLILINNKIYLLI